MPADQILMGPERCSKIISLDGLAALADQYRLDGKKTVLCHGCFDIVHPGHVRYLRSARSHGDLLVVSLTGDDAIEKADGTRPYIPQEYRADSLAALEFVDHVVICDGPTAEPVIRVLGPDLYVKGREYEHSSDPRFHAERELVEAHSGRVMFSSGDVVFSSTTILDSVAEQIAAEGFDDIDRLRANCPRWGVDRKTIGGLLNSFSGARVMVVGDAICDRYVFCETAEVADEAPVLTLRPQHEASYLGGAAVIAGHLAGLGAKTHLLTTVADDEPSSQMLQTLDRMGVEHQTLQQHRKLPIKLRYLAGKQKLLKIDQGEPHPLDSTAERWLLAAADEMADGLDAVILTDFGYGTVTASLLESLLPRLRERVPMIAGDVSGPRRTLLSMGGLDLLTPTEGELRGVAGDFEQSLPTVAAGVMKTLRAQHLITTLSDRGAVLFHPREVAPERRYDSRLRCEHMPAMANRADDVVGAGDALLAVSTLAVARGANLQQAAYLGSVAAGIAVSRVGNLPLSVQELNRALARRPELINDEVAHHPLLDPRTPELIVAENLGATVASGPITNP